MSFINLHLYRSIRQAVLLLLLVSALLYGHHPTHNVSRRGGPSASCTNRARPRSAARDVGQQHATETASASMESPYLVIICPQLRVLQNSTTTCRGKLTKHTICSGVLVSTDDDSQGSWHLTRKLARCTTTYGSYRRIGYCIWC